MYLGFCMVLMEHQFFINKNMPLRFLMYIARVYEKFIDAKSVYKEEEIKMPTPEFIVLYNGEKINPEEEAMRLSEAFMEKNVPVMLDVSVKVININ